jgi:hypothetical protein
MHVRGDPLLPFDLISDGKPQAAHRLLAAVARGMLRDPYMLSGEDAAMRPSPFSHWLRATARCFF